jgi:hypothetical protein
MKRECKFPLFLLKFCEKKEHANAILDGKLYMKESGFFRKLEDGYRGDRFDGRKPIDLGDTEVYLESEDGEGIYLNGVPGAQISDFSVGFSGDDKIPIFCACMLDERMIEADGADSFRIKAEYLEEMSKFGKYAVLIQFDEMAYKLKKFHKKNRDIGIKYGPVEYTDILKEYSGFDLADAGASDLLKAFFCKDNSYKMQNEWRVLMCAKEPLIGDNEDFWICDVGPFECAIVIEVDMLKDGVFHFGEEAAS